MYLPHIDSVLGCTRSFVYRKRLLCFCHCLNHPTLLCASRADYQPNGQVPVSSSAVAPSGQVYTPKGLKDYEVPRALEESEIPQVVEQYRQSSLAAAAISGVGDWTCST
jgi:hypothetical protein